MKTTLWYQFTFSILIPFLLLLLIDEGYLNPSTPVIITLCVLGMIFLFITGRLYQHKFGYKKGYAYTDTKKIKVGVPLLITKLTQGTYKEHVNLEVVINDDIYNFGLLWKEHFNAFPRVGSTFIKKSRKGKLYLK